MPDPWKVLVLVSAAAACVAVVVSLGVLRRLVTAVENGHGAPEVGLMPLDGGGISVGTQLSDFDLSEPIRIGTHETSGPLTFYSLLTSPRIIVLTRHGCSGCENLIKARRSTILTNPWHG